MADTIRRGQANMKIQGFATPTLNEALPNSSAPEVPTSWSVCIPDGLGNVQRYDTTSIIHAESTMNDWLLAGWPAWIQDNNGNLIHSAGTKPRSTN